MQKTLRLRRYGALFALIAVILGAFGAHALKGTLIENGTFSTWETAVRYQMWHALALILLSLMPEQQQAPRLTGNCFIVGILLFSGSLYPLALGGPSWLGPITPLGGLCLIIGWVRLARSCTAKNILQG
ncbi:MULTISPECIES: DUF423 domain-containing protein [unclassified Lentimonas]|uniref:DUF423 domain-containing protein n=1 Tax=unclassified Lentimonas TaxID=2630993 RepID=UPI0013265D3C|nr:MULTISPECIES: DUF423 domain-containing protein [unclassified Lentimonas]CAA6676623.1 COG2363 [Lentimonas sp. CC4]CAA6684714.1 COG2363 [Lentimonas sp. CC6]CAA7075350.1 COG2363 [Lentimonas sp. CC4]CAA7170962.1 COG2363 [Lentimonas sp. CC21]CAA7182241.1 COG2363 [Lentimonas sp. CC8]